LIRDRVVSTSRRYKGHTDATRRRLDFDELSSSSSSSLSDDQPPEDHHQEQRYQPQQLEKADSATIYRPWEVSSKDMLALPGIFILSVLYTLSIVKTMILLQLLTLLCNLLPA